MNTISILLVDNPCFNITKIDSALAEADLNFSLYFAGSGKSALDILMGDSFHELIDSDTVKLKPKVVILSKELKDISAVEFLGIIGKYYSLRDVKIFLLSDSLTDSERFVYDDLGVSGYLRRPLDKEQVVKEIRPHLNGGRTHFALIPLTLSAKQAKAGLGAFIKGKTASMGLGTKIAAVVASVLMISGVARHNANERIKENITAGVVKMPEPVVKKTTTTSPLPPPAGKPASLGKSTLQKHRVSPTNEVTTAINSTPANPDSMNVFRKETESPVLQKKPRDLRIIVIEEPDSISD